MMNDTAKRRRIKIGLLVSHLEDDFDDAVAEGAMIGAEQCSATPTSLFFQADI